MKVSSSSPSSTPKHSPFAAASTSYIHSLLRSPQQKKMSITQTYYLAHTARKKLTREASRADHDLRLLVGHANFLDSLMVDLADAEQEQERWFNQTVSGVAKGSQDSKPRHIQWASTVVEPEEEWDPEDASDLSDSDEEDDSDFDENDFVINTPVRRRAPSPVAPIMEPYLMEDEDEDDDTDSDFEYDDVEDLAELSLTRSPSRQSPPELLADSDDSSEDEALPPSPTQPVLEPFDEKQATPTGIPLATAHQPHLFESGYYVSQEQNTIIEAY